MAQIPNVDFDDPAQLEAGDVVPIELSFVDTGDVKYNSGMCALTLQATVIDSPYTYDGPEKKGLNGASRRFRVSYIAPHDATDGQKKAVEIGHRWIVDALMSAYGVPFQDREQREAWKSAAKDTEVFRGLRLTVKVIVRESKQLKNNGEPFLDYEFKPVSPSSPEWRDFTDDNARNRQFVTMVDEDGVVIDDPWPAGEDLSSDILRA